MKRKSMLRIPPDKDSLELKITCRANYQVFVFQDGRCRPVRHTLPALPKNLSRLVSTHNSDPIDDDHTSADNSDSSESEADGEYIVD